MNGSTPMKKSCLAKIAVSLVLAASAGPLFAQPYSLDDNGNGIQYIAYNPFTMPFTVAPDPTHGITGSSVLIYSLGAPVISGDVALMEPDGTTVFELLRFFTPRAGGNSDVIVYAQPNGTLAGVGIPNPVNPVEIPVGTPDTIWQPGANQPGETTLGALPVFEFFRYTIITAAPEPSSAALLLIGAGILLAVWGCRRKISPVRTSLRP
jgi:hypothetical protein